MNKRSLQKSRLTFALMVAALLGACTTPGGPVAVNTRGLEARAAEALEQGDLRVAADLFVQLADTTSGSQRAGFLLEAAQLEIELGNLLTARDRVARAQPLTDDTQRNTVQLLLARLELAEDRPADALTRARALLNAAATDTRAAVLEIAGLAQFALGQNVAAIQSLSEREVWLNDIDLIRANQQTLWLNLFAVAPATPQTGEPIVDGWLALAPIRRIADEAQRRVALIEWRRSFRQHPAARILLRDLMPPPAAPRRIALLLPVSSAAREEARAIRDGFMAAHLSASMENNSGGRADIAAGANDLTVRVYDTGVEGAEAAYQRAEDEGADFIVGPLFRNSVESVLLQSGFVPTLVLNHTLGDEEVYAETYQFALAPEDEAVSVARRAISLEQQRAAVLVPDTVRGTRIYNRFKEEYEALGGEVLAMMYYDRAIRTYGQRISSLLNLDLSESREATLQANLGDDIEFAPRRRQDIDMIFLIANAADGRQLAPQLEYYYAGDIPTYAISEIHDLNSRNRESDLNRIVFPEVPWLIAPDTEALRLQQTIAERWPGRSVPMARFFGMGVDSYRIIRTLYENPFFTSVNGSTGELRMDTDGRIHRALPFAQYRGGVVQPLEDSVTPADAPEDNALGNPAAIPSVIDTPPDNSSQRTPIESGFPEQRPTEPGG